MGEQPFGDIVSGIDWSNPDHVTESGQRVFSVRCRTPFSMPAGFARASAPAASGEAVDLSDVAAELGIEVRSLSDVGHNGDGERVLPDDGDGIILPDDASGDTGGDDEEPIRDTLVSGIASSTSVDFYGTEMSLRALKIMAVQMLGADGIVYIPRHSGAAGSIEWDETIGRTVHAEVVPTEQAAKPFNEAESQFMLRATMKLYANEPKAQALLRRLSRGEKIGQSIGGWFTHLQVVQNEDGDVDRVIVQGVELDHLAVTRAPANPDSLGIVHLRSKLQESSKEWAERTRLADEERHILSAQDNGDGSVTLVLASAEDDERSSDGDEDRDSAGVSQASEPAESADTASASLDNNVGTAHDAGIDARRSAPTDPVSTPSDESESDTPSEEYAMTEEDLQRLQAVLSKSISDATAPLIERVESLEVARAATPSEPEPADAELVEDPRIAEFEARALAAERALETANRRPVRVGRSVAPYIESGPGGASTANGLVDAARSKAPTLAVVAERSFESISTASDVGTTVKRRDLETILSRLLTGAENDGIITDPTHAAVWK